MPLTRPRTALREKALAGLPLFARSAMKDSDANIRRGTAAMNQALLNKTTVHRAMFRNGLGWVDFEWGDAKKGIAHIIAQRMAKDDMSEAQVLHFLTHGLVDAIANGTEQSRALMGVSLNVRLIHGDNIAVLVKRPASNAWVLTGFERWPSGEQGVFSIPSCLRKPCLRVRATVWELTVMSVSANPGRMAARCSRAARPTFRARSAPRAWSARRGRLRLAILTLAFCLPCALK
jgi:hypothetical protein